MKKGFTLIEIMTVLGIVVILAVVASINLGGFVRTRSLDLTVQSISTFLRDAQQRAINQEGGRYWGVRVENVADRDRFSLFNAIDSVPNDVKIVSTGFVRNGVEFLEPPAATAINIIFKKISGRLANCSSVILLKLALVGDANSPKTVKIYCNGSIEI